MSTETALVPTKESLATETSSWASRAAGLKVIDRESCLNASHLLRSIKTLRSQVQAWFAPHLEAAMDTKRKAEAARKGLADEQARMESPLIEAERVLKATLLTFEQDQERARLDEERRLQAEAQKRAEALTLEAAAAMEAEAVKTGDTAMLDEAFDILGQPIDAPVVSVAKSVPKVQGVTYRDQWKAHPQVDIKALAAAVASGAAPAAFLVPDMTAINQFARATKGTHPVAGIRWFNDRQVAARG
jgi:hypothetical protein